MVTRLLALVLVALMPAPYAPAAAPNAPAGFEVTITGGPHAGTYKGTEVGCFLLAPSKGSPKEFEVASSRGSSRGDGPAIDPKVLNAVRIHVYQAEKAGPVTDGFAHVIFGTENKPGSTMYEVRLKSPRDKGTGTITFAVSGQDANAGFDGRTGQGIRMHIAMHCTDLMAF